LLNKFVRYDADGEHIVESITSSDNFIIKGNNLLTLHSLKKRYSGKIKLIFIDPPYNTGNDSFGYNDSFNQSTWLTFIKNRLQVAYNLLSADGTLCVMIDHNELSYCMAVIDEIFGKENLRNIITVKRGSVTGAKVINPGVVNLSDYALIYSKSLNWKPNRVFRAKARDSRYNAYIDNYEEDYQYWRTIPLLDAFAESRHLKKKDLKNYFGDDLDDLVEQFVVENAQRIVQFATLDDNNISQAARDLKRESINNPDKGYLLEREDKNPYYVFGGKLMLFAKDRLIDVDGRKSFSEPISDIWDDVLPNDLHNEGGVIFKKGKKPERLLHRILELCTQEGEIVLDYHLGSGTTAAVALKMNRRFIGAEQMDYGENDSVQRLRNVIGNRKEGIITGYDNRGISTTVNWQGGGSFVYCELATANQRFVDAIEAATTTEQLTTIWADMQATGFLSWKVKPKEIDDNIADFAELSIDNQKRFLIECLDKNMLYVPLSEINSEEFGISQEDKNLNSGFYSMS
jgi:adenine-specific DNA-methyltransferase